MSSKNVLHVSDSEFQSKILNGKGYFLVDFWAPWCGPCKQLGPVIDELASERHDVQFVKINIDDNPESASNLGIRSIPTLILFKDGENVETRLGAMSKTALNDWLNNHIK